MRHTSGHTEPATRSCDVTIAYCYNQDILYIVWDRKSLFFISHAQHSNEISYQRLCARLQCPQCVSNGGTTALHLTHWGWGKRIFLNKNVLISLKISLKFVPTLQIKNIPSLVQIMAWHQPGAKPLSEPIMVSLLMHICVTRPQWVNISCITLSASFNVT